MEQHRFNELYFLYLCPNMKSLKIWSEIKASLSDQIYHVAQRETPGANPDILRIPRVVNIVKYFVVRLDFRIVVYECIYYQNDPSLRLAATKPPQQPTCTVNH